jgi:hypothetical protein
MAVRDNLWVTFGVYDREPERIHDSEYHAYRRYAALRDKRLIGMPSRTLPIILRRVPVNLIGMDYS